MAKTSARTVVELLARHAGARRGTVGIIYRGDPSLPEAVTADGWRAIIIGDRFRPLHRVHRRLAERQHGRSLAIEAQFDAIPIAPRSLDALVITRGLPARPPVEELRACSALVRDGGLVLWPHPHRDGTRGALGCLLVPLRRRTASPARRSDLCAWAMAASLGDVTQTSVGGSIAPWVVTAGRAGRRPWLDTGSTRDAS